MFKIYNLRTILHSLILAKGYAMVLIVTFAVTLGALIAVFNLNYHLFAKSLPIPAAEKLAVIKGSLYQDQTEQYAGIMSAPALREVLQHFSNDVAKIGLIHHAWSLLRDLPDTPPAYISYVNADYQKMINLPMLLGRAFGDSEALGNQNAVAVISYSTWQRHYGGRQDILGQSVQVAEKHFSIIGVTDKVVEEPNLFGIKSGQTEIWVPLDHWELWNSESWMDINVNFRMLVSAHP